jgi:predicted DNA-binding protein
MPAIRTQIYLTAEQRHRIDTLTKAEGITLAEVVRRALDDYFRRQTSDVEAALSATFGAAPEASAPSRDEWNRG